MEQGSKRPLKGPPRVADDGIALILAVELIAETCPVIRAALARLLENLDPPHVFLDLRAVAAIDGLPASVT